MQGSKEILLSLTIGLTSFATLVYLNRARLTERSQKETPIAYITGQSADPALEQNWGLNQIEAVQAQRLAKASSESLFEPVIVVAIIDTGCDVHHPSLRRNIWVNPGKSGLDAYGMSKATNGIDDDDNGFVDDVHGWNFADDSPAYIS